MDNRTGRLQRISVSELEELVYQHVVDRGGAWATAKELSLELGYPWRLVSSALMHLVDDNRIEQSRSAWKSKRQRMRVHYIYRVVTTSYATFPHWLMPRSKK